MALPDWFLGLFGNGLKYVIVVISITVLTVIIERIIRKLLNKYFEKSSKHIKVDHTRYAVFKHLISAIIYLSGFGIAVYAVPSLRTLAVSLFAGAGILAVIVGFASQKAFSNLVSGMFIAIFKPFRVGDVIKFSDNLGVVEDITLRHTVIRNFENKRFIVPNSIISNQTIENYNINDEALCKFIEFNISYDSNIDKAMKIMRQEAEKHRFCIDKRSKEEKDKGEPIVNVRVTGFGDSSVKLRAWVWAEDPRSAFIMGCELNKSIKERFDKEGIEIPFNYMTVVYKKDMKKKKGGKAGA